MFSFQSRLLVCFLGLTAAASTTNKDALAVRTSTGIFTGQLNHTYPNVREFFSVPYGQDTAGKNRLQPPLAVPRSSEEIDATKYPPLCPQYVSSKRSIRTEEIPQFVPYSGASNLTAGISAPFASEDYLKLAIWTPANATPNSHLPVVLFWTGGGFESGGMLIPAQLPPRWVSRSQSHIVVPINYRSNILGFPNGAAVSRQNLGLLAQPRAFFAKSVTILNVGTQTASDTTRAIFTLVAKGVGCDFPNDATAELVCMQNVDYNKIITFIGRYQSSGQKPSIKFGTETDDKIVFSTYTERYQQGLLARVPTIFSSTANEGGTLATFDPDHPLQGVNQTAANDRTVSFLCGAAKSAALRKGLGLPTYRYQYAGNWTNQSPLPWMGAYHASDLTMLFGTYADGVGSSSPLEIETSETMEDLLLAFARDPWHGLTKSSWPAYDPKAENGGTVLRFGADGKAVQQLGAHDVEAICSGKGTYNPSP
ncbi:Carboxylesterase/lipase/ esterase [Zymoseptoria tritici IPO323]|uniref:Carboxylesterase/lipase/ esterase n=1 Tax=Zymoseptoria tritici (strain CBS 115943 / IPO323) TaxID=336722 RepID=F9XHG6_ZYMTI|nr:Carboxylesterase/lipase/ esterase [Zymoseptoria tritici IPO323]EGP85398.1 Carboxylesterase/lipase/ esterase [Zymoseptoria tritici IPO323]